MSSINRLCHPQGSEHLASSISISAISLMPRAWHGPSKSNPAASEQERGRTEAHGARVIREALGPNGQLMVEIISRVETDRRRTAASPPRFRHKTRSSGSRLRVPPIHRRICATGASAGAVPQRPTMARRGHARCSLKICLTQPDVRHLMLIGAYRDNEVDSCPSADARSSKRFGLPERHVHEIRLAPLGRKTCEQLIVDALHCEPERAAPLAQLVHEKTAGNPFFAIQFHSRCSSKRDCSSFDHDAAQWSWDLDRIHAKGYTDNVVDLMVAKIARVCRPKRKTRCSSWPASETSAADRDAISIVLRDIRRPISTRCCETAVRSELVERSTRTSYRFIHDRIQEAAYSLIPEESRAEAHLRIRQAARGATRRRRSGRKRSSRSSINSIVAPR